MEEVAALVAIALASVLAMCVADIFGFLTGNGWRYFSKKKAAKKASKEDLKAHE